MKLNIVLAVVLVSLAISQAASINNNVEDCKKCAPLVKKDCEICMKKFPKEDSSECVKKALMKEGKKECMECAKCEKPKLPFAPVQDCKKCAPLVKKDCEICMKKFPKEDSSECVKKALMKEGKKECMECAKCEKPKAEPVQDCKKCAPLVKKDCEICMKKFPKEDSSECVKKALMKEGKKECVECAKCEKPKKKDICKECAPLVKKDCEICMKKFPKEDSSECVKKALVKQGKKACMECAKCEKPKLPFIEPVQDCKKCAEIVKKNCYICKKKFPKEDSAECVKKALAKEGKKACMDCAKC